MERLISLICIFFFSLFLNVSNCFADELGSQLNNELSNETNSYNENNNDKKDIPKASNEDIFGDEQTFPFIAGLGKNAAH